jgi:hypothetical protein
MILRPDRPTIPLLYTRIIVSCPRAGNNCDALFPGVLLLATFPSRKPRSISHGLFPASFAARSMALRMGTSCPSPKQSPCEVSLLLLSASANPSKDHHSQLVSHREYAIRSFSKMAHTVCTCTRIGNQSRSAHAQPRGWLSCPEQICTHGYRRSVPCGYWLFAGILRRKSVLVRDSSHQGRPPCQRSRPSRRNCHRRSRQCKS